MSEKAKIVSILRETVETYIEGYYKPQYQIDETIQPKFWEAVILLCDNPYYPRLSDLINHSETADYCVKTPGTGTSHVSLVDYRARNTEQLVKNIANEIRENETKDINLSRVDIFLMKKKMEDWEEKLKKISLLF